MEITPEYRALNRTLHAGGCYGISGVHWAKAVAGICQVVDSPDVLDYGCGQRTLEKDDLRRLTRRFALLVVAAK